LPKIEIAAKSGTAQTTDNGKESHNSWVISFAPYENPKYAVCIMVQNGGSGGGVCGPLVNLVYRGLFARDNNGVKLPLKSLEKVPGNTDRIEKTIVIPPETIAAVEAGETSPAPEAIAAATPDPSLPPEDEISGETGDEVGTITAEPITPPADNTVTPTPTLTPEIDDEGTVIPRAVPVKDP
jgi:penicillin-binding protein 2